MTSGQLIADNLPDLGLRLEHEEGYERALLFVDYGTPEYGETALNFTVAFGQGAKTTSFTFDEETNRYYVQQYGRANIDGDNDNQQIAVTNVLILRMATRGIPGDNAGRLEITTTGTGTGYFVNGGKYIPINWSREDNSSQFIYTLEDDSPLYLGRGQTYIAIVRANTEIDFS
jgi:hypothetical protein